MTLVEILIALAVFGVFFTLACSTLVRCYSYYINTRNLSSGVRDTVVAFDKMQVELAQCVQVYGPDPTGPVFSEGQVFSPTTATPFVFSYQQPDQRLATLNGAGPPPTGTAVGYVLEQNVLERLVYATGADPTTSAPLQTQLVASPLQSFTVTHVPRMTTYNSLVIQANATLQIQDRVVPVFLQAQVLGMKAGL